MRTIHKYPLNGDAQHQQIELPAGAKILTVDFQNDQLKLWAWVDPEEKLMKKHDIYNFGTGDDIPKLPDEKYAYHYLKTVVGNFVVWHFFTTVYSPLGGEHGID